MLASKHERKEGWEKKRKTNAVGLDNAHLVTVDPEETHGEDSRVEDAETVGLASLEGDLEVVVEADGLGRVSRSNVAAVRVGVDEKSVGDGLSAGRVELVHEPARGRVNRELREEKERRQRTPCSAWCRARGTSPTR
jgi:hypothetical protein